MTPPGVVALGIDAARGMAGALLIDKPSGPTSHDVVAVLRRTLKTPRVGHTGTLDPLATGLLVMLIGGATRLAQFLATDEKEYVADIRLGVATPTYDAASLAEGVRSPMDDGRWATDVDLESVLDRFRGSFLQTPPPFSAKKIGGVAAYEKARRNETVELKPAPVTVRQLEVLSPSPAHRSSPIDGRDVTLVRLRVAASAGFYVRSLAHDLGQALGCGAHLEALRRMCVGRFRVEDALTLDRLAAAGPGRVIAAASLLGEMPAVTLTEPGVQRAGHGNPLGPAYAKREDSPLFLVPETDSHGGAVPVFVRLLDPDGTLLAVAEARGDGLLHPIVVLR
jgi:tRNA pseudouridine55 synthase